MPAPQSFAPFIPWARFALTGKPNTPLPNDAEFRETVAFVGPTAYAELHAALPASCRDGFGSYDPGSADEAAFNKAMGAKIASEFFRSPAGSEYCDNITKVITGGVTEVFAVASIGELIDRCETAAQKAIGLLSCVVEANRQGGTPSLVSFVGRPRSARAPYGHRGTERRY